MPIAGPQSNWQKFKQSTVPYDVGAAVLSGVSLVGTSAAAFARGDQVWGRIGLGLAALNVVVLLGKARATWLEQVRKKSTHELQGCLHTLESVLLGPDLEPAKRLAAGLRLTVHVPDGQAQLQQVMAYVGDQRAGDKTAGRKFPENVGVVGQAYRAAQLDPNKLEIFHDSRTSADHDAFVSQMVRDYSFSTASARALNPATMSWVAVAFREADGTVAGVLYCDSKQPDFFTDARQEDILHATVGIAYFVGLRYS